jgi:hypothetical protein
MRCETCIPPPPPTHPPHPHSLTQHTHTHSRSPPPPLPTPRSKRLSKLLPAYLTTMALVMLTIDHSPQADPMLK